MVVEGGREEGQVHGVMARKKYGLRSTSNASNTITQLLGKLRRGSRLMTWFKRGKKKVS